MLELEDVHFYYGRIHALHGVSLKVPAGKVVCLIGSNGAGKSTTLMAVSGVNAIARGAIRFEGRPVHGLPPDQIVRLGISQAPEGRRIFPLLTVLENLEMGAFLRRDAGESIEAGHPICTLIAAGRSRAACRGRASSAPSA